MNLTAIITIGIFTTMVAGCAGIKTVTPADRAHNPTFRWDCCNPGLSAGDKELCELGLKDQDHVLWDQDGNRYEFYWSDCKLGEEPWRKWD